MLMTKNEMLYELNRLMKRDWHHYMADRMTNAEKEEWRKEKAQFNALRENYKEMYGDLPNEIENWGFHIWG